MASSVRTMASECGHKSTVVKLRVATDERDEWQRAAEAAGLSLSEWIKRRCHGGGDKNPNSTPIVGAPRSTARQSVAANHDKSSLHTVIQRLGTM